MTRNQFFGTAVAALLLLTIAEQIHRGAGRAIFQISFLSYLTYLFWNMDKPWARRILNKPKSWWMN